MEVFLVLISVSCVLLDQGLSDAGSDVVQSEIGESVTLNTDVKINQKDIIWWYFNEILLVRINGEQLICEDDECKEKFGDRLKLDSQTGSLTIMNIRTTDSGNYTLLDSKDNEKIYMVSVTGKTLKMSVKEGESVTLGPSETKNTKDAKTWRYNNTLIAEITGGQRKICADAQCKERFRDRLEVNQTGSLTITNTRTTDSGEYHLQISSDSRRRRRSTDTMTFVVTVSAHKDSSASPGVGVVVGVLLVASAVAAAGVIYYRHRSSRKRDTEENNQQPLRKTNSEKEEDKDQMT